MAYAACPLNAQTEEEARAELDVRALDLSSGGNRANNSTRLAHVRYQRPCVGRQLDSHTETFRLSCPYGAPGACMTDEFVVR
eukprot:3598789-Pleurochrysis_carterae.AAC.1